MSKKHSKRQNYTKDELFELLSNYNDHFTPKSKAEINIIYNTVIWRKNELLKKSKKEQKREEDTADCKEKSNLEIIELDRDLREIENYYKSKISCQCS